ncbi:MAG: hypothetical protein D8B38_02250 [Candidatus Saccharimonas sp.]|nr:MAG: hypothetical protein D8B38_02250 [Candidatus Saccharimonas sp.]
MTEQSLPSQRPSDKSATCERHDHPGPVAELARQVKQANETDARKAILEDLFYDFHQNRAEVYKMNFIRGIFFGLGSVLGGTILVALFVWLLNAIGLLVPGLADFIDSVIKVMNARH